MSKKKAAPKAAEKDPKALQVKGETGKTEAEMMAGVALDPEIKAAATIRDNSKSFGEVDITELWQLMERNTAKIVKGDLSLAERHLAAQAQTLDTVFHRLLAKINGSMPIDLYKAYMTFALKAQAQSRMTWETLALVKNPPPYIRQQNVAVNQQVNNGALPPRGAENPKSTNELLSDKRGEYETLDTGGTAAAGGTDPELEAVAAVNGAKDVKGQG